MPHAHAHILRASYDAVPSKTKLFERFYEVLFERAPDTRRLFPSDVRAQREHLAAAISALVSNAQQFGAFEPMLRELGERHVAYGAKPEHYPVVAAILLEVLAESLRDAWTPEVREAWTITLNSVCDIMARGARMARSAA